MNLRPYQDRALTAINKALQTTDTTLLVMPTGTGKTVVIAHAIKQSPPGRTMVLAHREELIWQGQKTINAVTGIEPQVEMAELQASRDFFSHHQIVMSTIQTQCAGENGAGRMTRFDPAGFSLLVVDEAHHATAKTYRRVIDYYRQNPRLKVLGVTATPDRADEEALGQVFETVAFDYELPDAINDGWLVPIKQRMVTVDGLDYSDIRTTAGDLNGADLARVMEYEESLHAIATPTFELIGNRKTLLFAASIAHAERLCEIFNRHRTGIADFVCGGTPKEKRRRMLKDYHTGEFQILCNVGVATEGFDEPGIAVVVMARPTKSRSLYAQMAGRGTRPLAGLVDRYADADARRHAIAVSGKPDLEIIDFVANSGRHKLITAVDILGGRASDAAVERARKELAESDTPRDVADILLEADREIEKELARAQRAALKAKANYSTILSDPFNLLSIEPRHERGWNKGKPPTEKQLSLLDRMGVPHRQVETVTQASQVIDTIIKRRQAGRCTYKQAALLVKYGYSPDTTFDHAKSIIDAIADNGWKRPAEGTEPKTTVTVY